MINNQGIPWHLKGHVKWSAPLWDQNYFPKGWCTKVLTQFFCILIVKLLFMKTSLPRCVTMDIIMTFYYESFVGVCHWNFHMFALMNLTTSLNLWTQKALLLSTELLCSVLISYHQFPSLNLFTRETAINHLVRLFYFFNCMERGVSTNNTMSSMYITRYCN